MEVKTMLSNENTISSQTCEFCGAQIPENSTKCGHCGEWRKDIKQLRIKFFVSLALLFIVCAITFIGALSKISLFILICTFSYLSFLYGSLLKKKIGTLW
jgi:predicted nucleic acid-binding Zn ribbon protein